MPVHPLLVRSKTSPPTPPPAYVPRLPRFGGAAPADRIIVVHAPPGYGKTLLARELSDHGDRRVWYGLDTRDRDPETLLTGLLTAVAANCPEIRMAEDEVAAAAERGRHALLGTVRETLAELTEPVLFVLDDAHHLDRTGWASDLLEALAFPRGVPAQVICTSRHPMTLSWNLVSRDGVRRITETDLAFSPEETVALFEAHGHSVDHESAANLLRPLEGWPAALHGLARRDGPDRSGAAQCLDGELLTQLTTGLLDDPADDIHDFLLRTAVLRRFNVALCRQLAGPGAAKLLRAVRDRSPFVLALDSHGSWYRYHGQLRRLLESRLRADAGVAGLRQAHRSAARAWQLEGEHTEAIHHLLLAGDWKQAASTVSEAAPRLLESGAVTQVGEWLGGLPPAQLRDNPALAHIEGVVDMHSGYLTEARTAFLRARENFIRSGSTREASKSTYWLASTMVSHPQSLEGLDLRSDRIDRNDQWQPFVDLCLWQSMLLANRREEAEHLRRRALRHPQAQGNLPFVAYRQAIEAMYELRGRGELQTGLNQLQDAARVMRKSDPLSRLPVVLAYGVVLLWDMGRRTEARQWLERAHEATRSKGTVGFNSAWLELMRARLDLRDGRVEEAAAVLDRLRAHRRSGGYVWRAHQVDLLAAEVALDRGDAGPDLVRTAYDHARAYGYRHEIAWTATELADALSRCGRGDAAAEYAALAVDACEPHDTFLLRRARAFSSSAPRRAVPAPAPSDEAAPVDGHLRIQTLGDFVVHRGGEAMPAAAWGRRRARQLFKLLLSAGRPLHREEIIDLLWPEQNRIEASQRGLNTTVYWLRRALEPELRRGQESRYVVANAQCYSLVLRDGDTWDVDRLRAAAADPAALDLRAACEAFDLACADYLPSDRYEEWADPVRNELLRHREALLDRAVAEARRADDVHNECTVLERALEVDPWREEITKDLLRAYVRAGRHDAARRLYNDRRGAA